MNSWKKQWREELDKTIPPLRKDIKEHPIPIPSDIAVGNNTAARARIVKPAYIFAPLIAVIVLAAIALILSLCLPTRTTPAPARPTRYAFAVDINPSIIVTTDGDGVVTDVFAVNADADVVLSDEMRKDMLGAELKDALTLYVDRSAMLGYIAPVSSTVNFAACEYGSELLSSASAALENYFMDKGIYAVVQQSVEHAEKFGARIKTGITEENDIFDFIADAEPTYFKRNSALKDSEELFTLYDNYISTDAFMFGLRDRLQSELDVIKRNAEDIGEICALYFDIFDHPDNPAKKIPLFKGYWNVKKYYSDSIDGEFAALVKAMDAALEQYRKNYGVDITDEFQMTAVAENYVKLSVSKLTELLTEFSVDGFKENVSSITAILDAIGAGDDPFIEIFDRPSSAAEFNAKMASALAVEYSYREKQFSETYNAVREKISVEDYERYKNSVLQAI